MRRPGHRGLTPCAASPGWWIWPAAGRAPRGAGRDGRCALPPRARRGRLPRRRRRPRLAPPQHRRPDDGRQPIANEDGSVAVVFNGELFDYPERRRELEAKGHRFRTHRHRADPAPVGRARRRDVRAPARPVRLRPVGQQRADAHPGPRPLRHLPAVLDAYVATPTALAAVRLGDQGAARLGHGAGQAGSPRAQPRLHLLRHARAGHLLRGRPSLLPGQYLQFDLGARTPGRSRFGPAFYWQIDFPDRGQEEDGDAKTHDRRLRASAHGSGREAAAGRRAGRVVPLRRRRFERRSWRWPARRWAGRSRPSPISIQAEGLERRSRSGAGRPARRQRADRRAVRRRGGAWRPTRS